MDWRLKCLAFHMLAFVPGDCLYRALQRRVTGRYLFTIGEKRLAIEREHVANFQRLGCPGSALEFGAGPHLLSPLMLSAAGASGVLTYDIDSQATPERVNHVIRQLRQLRVAGADWREITDIEDLQRLYRICYIAPGDARSTGLPAGSVDFVFSTSVLEHIDEPNIRLILRECIRVSSPGGLMSFAIDYNDHYAGFDSSIGKLNFLRYSERQWAKYNPPRHHQNRLRHSDFLRIFQDLGLEIVEQRRIMGCAEDLERIKVADCFGKHSREDLLSTGGRFLLKVH
ncbi:MAG: methyltransferase domain-containing protein [Gammaproteobacteria bacterium]|nr:MAG: methyltransferase domain-containing protein [Gammaproteobacteria bacterium]